MNDEPFAASPATSETHLHGSGLLVARGFWLLLAAGVLVNFLVGIPAYYTQQQTVCVTNLADCTSNNIPTSANVQALHQLGLSLPVYAAVSTFFVVAVTLLFLAVGALIFWRKSDTWLGLFASLVLVITGSIANNVPNVLVTSGLLLMPYGFFLFLLAFALILGIGVFLLIFPTGQFAPRWTWVGALLWILFFASFNLPTPYNVSYWPTVLFAGELLLTVGGTLAVQIYRYRRVYTPTQRQQTKWLVFGASMGLMIEILSIIIGSLVPGLDAPDSPYQLLNGLLSDALFVPIPLAVGVAILRYRLWDIDTIINKALVYGSLTVLLAALYAGLIIGLTALAGVITGPKGQQPLALVVATLAIAALFLPARRRLQGLIDRRFYRRKYDAEKTLAAFSAALRSEVDLNDLREQLIAVVRETMQPTHVSLWLREAERPRPTQVTKEQ